LNEIAEKIKVLHLIHTLETGGAQKVIVNLIRGMDRDHFDFTTACMQRKGPIYDEIKSLKSRVVHIQKKHRLDPNLVSRLRKFIRENDFKIVHTHNFSAGLWGRLAASGIKKNRPVLIHTEHGRRASTDLLRKILKQHLACYTDRIIAVSDETRQYMIEKEGIPADKIEVIRNGIDLDYLMMHKDARVKEIESIREKDKNARIIVNVSALTEVKDHACLLEALRILLKKVPSAYLFLVGDGPLRLDLQKQAISLGIDDKVNFMGERHDIAAILAKSDLFVLSSKNEGHPISLLEAMGMGVVPVTTQVGGIPEVLVNTVHGLMVAPGEPSLLAQAMRIPLEEPQLRNEWSLNAMNLIKKEYTAAVMAGKHEELYLKLIEKKLDISK
jgi:glycosyltransferase involved in cell wall biosynthesis